MLIVNTSDAKNQLATLIRQALDGERVVIAHAGEPLVELTPIRPKLNVRVRGLLKGQLWISEDFDTPLTELEDAIYGADSTTRRRE